MFEMPNLQHVSVSSLSDGPQMWRHLVPPLAEVHLDHGGAVDGVALVGVDHHAEQARVGVDQLGLVPGLQVPEDRGIIEECQIGHVFALLEFWRVDLSHQICLEGLLLMAHRDDSLGSVSALQKTLLEATISIRTPHGLLSIIGLGHGLPLHVHGDDEVGAGVGVRLPGLTQFDVTGHLEATSGLVREQSRRGQYINKRYNRVNRKRRSLKQITTQNETTL